MAKMVGQILRNSIRKIYRMYDLSKVKTLEEISTLSLEDLQKYALEISCRYSGFLYHIQKVNDYIKFVEDNKDVD